MRFTDPDGMEGEDQVQKKPVEKTAQDLNNAASKGKTVQQKVENVDKSIKKGDDIKGTTLLGVLGFPAKLTQADTKLISQIDKIEKTGDGTYTIKLKDGQDKVSGSFAVPSGKGQLSLDVTIKNGATINLSQDKGTTTIDIEGVKVGKGFLKVGIPDIHITNDKVKALGISN